MPLSLFRTCRITALVVLVGCASEARTPPLTELASPTGPRSGEPFLHVDGNDRVHMTWIERTGDSTHAVRYARLDGTTWTTPTTISERRDLFVNWADFPSVVATASGRLVAHWLQRSGTGGRYAYDVRVAESRDAGATWSGGGLLHTDAAGATEHGFVALWLGAGDSVFAAWLDGRDTGGQPDAARGAMSVRQTSVGPDGVPSVENVLDLRTCECCQVNAAVGARGPIVVYRDRSTEEIRDIGVVRQVDGRWTEPGIVHDDRWRLEACPVNGPAVAARGDTAVVAWFTGAQDTARVRVAWSFDGGATFNAPLRIDGGDPVGRVDVELLADGAAAVTWLERVPPSTGEVRARRVSPSGTLGTPILLASTSSARPSGFPKLVRRGSDLIAAWTVPGDTARVKLALLPASALP
ncbi:MAG: exo-alpha-sialidase [Gemmatimonadaceae bacterium]|nr:exo-alpha-sialidase [Gemmatimonadaceae bacterium]